MANDKADIEVEIYDLMMATIKAEAGRIKRSTKRDAADIAILEKLAKTYAILCADLRETVKAGLN